MYKREHHTRVVPRDEDGGGRLSSIETCRKPLVAQRAEYFRVGDAIDDQDADL